MIPEFVTGDFGHGHLGVFGVAALTLIVAIITHLAFPILIKISQRNGRDALDTKILEVSRGPVVLFLITLGVFLSYFLMTKLPHQSFDFFDGHGAWATRVWLVITIIEVSYLISQIIQTLLAWYVERLPEGTSSDLNNKLLAQARWFTPLVIYTLGALMALDTMGVAVTPLMAGLGIGGIAAALALQPTLSNVFWGHSC